MLTVKDVMNRLNLSKPTIYRLVENGEIPVIRIGGSLRFEEREIEDFINSKRERRTR